jgi:type IX secretion system PorP/SprF family membrane protein
MRIQFLTAIFLLTAIISRAQDPLFTQYYHSPLYMNPGLTGTSEHTFRACINTRLQWHNVPSVMRYGVISADGYNERYEIGGGMMLSHFNEGYLRTTNASLLFSKQFGTEESSPVFASIGFQAGFTFRGLNTSKLLFADQIGVEGPIRGAPTEADRLNFNDKPFFDISSGFVFTWKNFMIGGAWHHMTQPYNNLIGYANTARLPSRFSGSLSYLYTMDKNDPENSWVLKPTILYNQQFQSRFLVAGLLVETPASRLSFGTWYRNNSGLVNNHSLSFGVNFTLGRRLNYLNGASGQKSRAGISYDIELNRPGPRYTAGSTELGGIYESNIPQSDNICPKPYRGADLKKYPWAFQ